MKRALPVSDGPCFHRDFPDSPPDTASKARFVLERLMERARQRCGYIEPCAGKSWEECLTTLPNGKAALWFNDSKGSTRMVSESEVIHAL